MGLQKSPLYFLIHQLQANYNEVRGFEETNVSKRKRSLDLEENYKEANLQIYHAIQARVRRPGKRKT